MAHRQVHAPRPRPGTADGGIADLRYEVMYFLEAPDDDDPRVQGRVGRHRRLDRRGGRRRHLELPHPHRRHRRRGRGGHRRAAGPATSGSPICSSRSRRSAGSARPSPTLAVLERNEPVETAVVAVATGDGIRRIFHSLGVQRIVTGGQTMNPSTAQLLEAVEAAPADQVVILPEQQEHHPGGRAGRRRDRPRPCSSCPPGGVAEGFASLLAYDPEAGRHRQRQGHGRGGRRGGGRRGHPGRARLDLRARADHRGRLPRHRPRRHPGAGQRARPGVHAAARPAGHRRPRDRHHHRGRGLVGGRAPATSRGGSATTIPTSPPRSTTAASRCTPTCSASSSGLFGIRAAVRRRVGLNGERVEPARTWLADSPNSPPPRHRARRGGAQARRGAGQARPATPCSTCSPTTRGATSTAPTSGASTSSTSARRPWCSATVKAVHRPAHPDAQDHGGGRRDRRLGLPAGSRSSTSRAGERQLKPGTERGAVRQGRAVQRPAADDEPGGRPGRATRPGASCRCTRSRRRPAS